ncbi:MAG: septation protein IspZ [Spirochaetes bacterium]|nr:septation protein IspZ [Spirochaetota bacterium]
MVRPDKIVIDGVITMDAAFLFVQLLPLLVFLIVDAIFNNTIVSIIAAVVFSIGQMVFFYVTTKQFDYFILLDVGLIVALGVVSLVLKNDMFFKMKPALIEAIALVFLLVLVFAPTDFLTAYISRYMQGRKLTPEGIALMKRMLLGMSVYVIIHIGAVIYTAYFSSRKVWAFVSGPGFYLLFIPVMIYILIRRFFVKRKS